ncbi:MAG: hypothetical protein R3F19_21065 [Verrucomicrobiales bacterium]
MHYQSANVARQVPLLQPPSLTGGGRIDPDKLSLELERDNHVVEYIGCREKAHRFAPVYTADEHGKCLNPDGAQEFTEKKCLVFAVAKSSGEHPLGRFGDVALHPFRDRHVANLVLNEIAGLRRIGSGGVRGIEKGINLLADEPGVGRRRYWVPESGKFSGYLRPLVPC